MNEEPTKKEIVSLSKSSAPKRRKLTKKQRIFVNEYADTGNGTKAALKAYDTDDYNVANAIATENLQKPAIQEALGLDDESLQKKHIQLLNQKRLEYFVFPKYFEDDEIVKIVEEDTGIKVINIRETEKGKMAWYATDDALAQDKALDKGYRLKGKYAPEKHVNVDVKLTPERARELANRLIGIHR